MKSNVFKYYVNMMMNIVTVMLAGGSILQAFLMESGLGEENVNFLMSASQMIQVGIMLGLSKVMDNSTNIIKISAYSRLCDLPLMLALLILCFVIPGNKTVLFGIMFLLLVIYSVGIGITNISGYKLPYLVIDVNDYGKITAIGGIVGGIMTAVMSWGMSYLQKSFDYFYVMKWIFLLAIISLAMYVIATASLKEIYQHSVRKAEEKKENKYFEI